MTSVTLARVLGTIVGWELVILIRVMVWALKPLGRIEDVESR